MLSLLSIAIGQLLEAADKVRRLGPCTKELEKFAHSVRAGADPIDVRDKAKSIVRKIGLDGILRSSPRLLVGGGISEQVEEFLRREFGPLVETILATEAAGPRFGLCLTAATIFFHFVTNAQATPNDTGGFENVGIAVGTTGLGMFVAIVCSFAVQRVLLPMEDRLRGAVTEILVSATWPSDVGMTVTSSPEQTQSEPCFSSPLLLEDSFAGARQ
jgi:hypothetical protein